MNIQLKNGKTISVSTYEYYFLLNDEDVDRFFESCMADDLGTYIENPFSSKSPFGKLELDEDEEIEDIENSL